MIVSVEKPGTPEELVHVGVKGMKWGVRKERDSSGQKSSKSRGPLGKFKQFRSERKAKRIGKANSDIAKATAKINELKANPGNNRFTKFRRSNQRKELEGYRKQRQEDADDIRNNRLTDTQKKVIIGTAAVGAVLVAGHGAFKFVDSGTLHQFQTRHVPLKKNDLLSRTMSSETLMKEVIKPVNPDYMLKTGSMMNCRRCTLSTEMRRRGNDVKATNAIMGTGQTAAGLINATDPNAKFKTGPISNTFNWAKERALGKQGPFRRQFEQGAGMGNVRIPIISHPPKARGISAKLDADVNRGTTNKIFEYIGLHPPGSRGELGLRWHGKGAHSVYWEMIGEEPHIFDAQSGVEYTRERFEKEFAPRVAAAATTRLDNVDLNENFLRRWVTNA